MEDELAAQGWYRDPFGRHEDRWFSMGRPTGLVRDGHAESRDEPPDEPYPTPLVPTPEVPRPNETVRAGDVPGEDPNAWEITFGTTAMAWGARTRQEPPSTFDW
jgi:hypothetical protein